MRDAIIQALKSTQIATNMDIAEQLKVDKRTATEEISKLVEDGLVIEVFPTMGGTGKTRMFKPADSQ